MFKSKKMSLHIQSATKLKVHVRICFPYTKKKCILLFMMKIEYGSISKFIIENHEVDEIRNE